MKAEYARKTMTNITTGPWRWLTALAWLVCLLPALSPSQASAEAVCANVKIEIQQELTLERQAFDAVMRINNGLDTMTLSDFNITVTFQDDTGNAVTATSDPNDTSAAFFIRIDTTDGITDLVTNGANITSGSVAPKTTAELHWLIIPSPGAGGESPEGQLYYVGATLSYNMGGELESVDIAPDFITVKPMPLLALDYFLTEDVFADDAFTSEVEPPEPFTLGLRIQNNGAAAAQNMQIDSAQPTITSNDQGLPINFTITGSYINNQPTIPTLLLNFGDVEAGTATVGRWIMETTLSGTFVDFDASFTHADELGGAVTSLIDPNSINTHLLVHDVRVDLPGRDSVRDFLAHDTGSTVLRVYESDSVDTVVNDLSTAATFALDTQNGTEVIHDLIFTATPGFAYVKLADPYAGDKVIKSVTRNDGKIISLDNAWLSKERNFTDPNNPTWDHYINFFDADTSGVYTVYMGDAEVGNLAPVFQAVPAQSTTELQALSFILQASDPNGTIPIITASALPVGAILTDNGNGTATFDWMPTVGQGGTYNIIFQASDGVLSDSLTVPITIVSAVDSDGDSINDDWELQYFGSLDQDGSGDFDGDGISNLQEYLDGTDPTIPAADAPLNVIAAPGSEQNTISWDPVTGATSYTIYWSTVPGVSKETGNIIADVTSPYVHLALDNGQTYYYVVTAYHSGGESVESTEISATPGIHSWGTPLMLENDNTGDAALPQIAMDEMGNGIAVWQQSDGVVSSIWADIYSVGSGWSGTPVLLENDNTGDARMPEVAMDANGNAMAVWLQSDGGRDNVMAARYLAGSGWQTPVLIETNDSGPAYAPHIGIDGAGNALVVWTHSNGTALADSSLPGNEVWSNRFDAVAGAWGTASAIESTVTVYATATGIAVGNDGNAMAVWSESDDGQVFNVQAARYTAGSGWQVPESVRVSITGSTDSTMVLPALAMDTSGTVLITWAESNAVSTNVWVRRYDAASGWQDAHFIESNDEGNAYQPSVAFDSVGNALAIWSHSDGVKTNIWSNYYDATAGSWSGAVQADTANTGAGSSPQAVFTPDGSVLAVWQQNDLIGENVWASRYIPATGWTAAQIIETENLGDALYPQLAMNGAGDALAVWQQDNGTVTNIWANDYLVGNTGVPNIPPVAWTGQDTSVDEGVQANLSGAESFDQDGSVVSYSWLQTGGPAVTLSDQSSASPSYTAPLVVQDEVLTFELTVTDSSGATGQRSISITVLNINSDDDSDGLDDAWEIQYFGNLTQDSTTDFDGDGITDLEEYQQGSSPTLQTPAVPTNVVVLPAVGQVTLSWQPDAIATSYNIYWGTEPGVTPATGNLISNASTPYVHTGLTPEATYYYIVTGVAGEESAPSTEVSATAGRYAWEVPTAFSADATSSVNSAQLLGDTLIAVWSNSNGNIMSANFSDTSGWSSAAMLDSGTGGATNVSVASDGLGNAIAVWIQSDGSGNNIWANHYSNGVGWETAETLTANDHNADLPEIAMDDSGNAVIAWRQTDGIFSQRFTASSGWEARNILQSFSDYSQYYSKVSLAMNASGNAFVTWIHNDTTGERHTLNTIGYNPASGWGTLEVSEDISTTSYTLYKPAITIDDIGNVAIIWYDGNKVLANLYLTGSGWQNTVTIIDGVRDFVGRPKVVITNTGVLTVFDYIDGIWADLDYKMMSAEYRFDSGWEAAELIVSQNYAVYQTALVAINDSGKYILNYYVNNYPNLSSWVVMKSPTSGWETPQFLGNGIIGKTYLSSSQNIEATTLWHGIDDSVIYTSRYRLFDSPPTADGQSQQSIYGGQTLSLDGSGSYDIDGTIQSYLWTASNDVSSGAGTPPSGDSTSPVWSTDITWVNPYDFNGPLQYALTVTDDDGAMVTDIVYVSLLSYDTDSDSIDDLWELQYFGSLDSVDGTSDFDGDGVSDLIEYQQNTNPTLVTPPAPQNVTVQAGISETTLSWDPVPGAVSYNIYWSNQAGVDRSNGTLLASVSSPYLHSNLNLGSTYYYVVTAVGADESIESSEVSAMVGQLSWSNSNSVHTDTGLAAEAHPVMSAGGSHTVAVWAQSGNIQAAVADSGVWGAAELLETSNKNARNPEVAMNSSGTAVAVWEQVSPSDYSIFASRYDPATGWSESVALESNSGTAITPKVVVDDYGNATVVWMQFDGYHYSIFTNRYIAGGGWQTAQLIEIVELPSHNPNLALDNNGNVMVVWEMSDITYDLDLIYANRFDLVTGWGAAEEIAQVPASTTNTYDIVGDASGNFIVVYDDSTLESSPREFLRSALYTTENGWNSWHPQLTLVNDYGISEDNPNIEMDANGNIILVWVENGEIMASHVQDVSQLDYNSLQKEIVSKNGAVVPGSNPELLLDQNGNGVVLWEETDGTVTSLWYSQYDSASGWGGAARLEDESMSAYSPQLAVQGDGTVLALWAQDADPDFIIKTKTLTEVNAPPIANAGNDQTVYSEQPVTLSGVLSSDSDGSISYYTWTQVSGPAVTLDDPTAQSPVFTTPLVESATPLVFSLKVSDDKGTTASDVVIITVLEHDTDADGMDDLWELQYFGNLNRDGSQDFDGDGITDLEEYQQGTNPTITTPIAPVGVSATAVSDGTVVNWDPVTNAVSYNLYWSMTPGVTRETGNKISDVTSPYGHSGLVLGTQYYYIITTVGTADESGPSQEVSAVAGQGTWESVSAIEYMVGDAGQVSLDTNAGGDAIAVWSQSDGIQTSIWANYYTAGIGWNVPELIESDDIGSAEKAEVMLDDSGNAIAVWQQSDGVHTNILSNRYSAGSGWGSAELVEFDDLGDALNPQLAVAQDGSGVAVWQQSDGVLTNIWSNRYTVGSGWGSAELVETDNSGDASNAVIGIDSTGNAIAAWQQSDGTRTNIVANSYTAGIGWGVAKLIETDDTADATMASVNVDTSGNAIAVWQQSDGAQTNIWSNRYVAGTGWGNAELIENNDSGAASDARLAIDSTGTATAVWQQSDGAVTSIWANRYTPGSGWSGPELLETDDTGDAGKPSIDASIDGDVVVLWQQWDGTRFNIQSNRYYAGNGWGTAVLVENDDIGDAVEPVVSMDAQGNAFAAWQQWDGSQYSINSTRNLLP